MRTVYALRITYYTVTFEFLEFVGSTSLPFGCGLTAAICITHYALRITYYVLLITQTREPKHVFNENLQTLCP